MSFGELLKHLQLSLELPPLYFGTGDIDEDFGPVEGSVDHGVVRDPSLFADLVGHRGVVEG